MVSQQETRTNASGQRLPTVPQWWSLERGGSDIEYYVWQAILRTGRVEGVDFMFQHRLFGGKVSGGAVADFLIYAPRVGINIQSLYYHATTAAQRAHDRMSGENIERSGLRLAYITEEDAINRPDGAVRDAIAGLNQRGPLGD